MKQDEPLEIGSEAGSSECAERSTCDMLYEFKRLGKAREAALKWHLNRLASLSILPGGYARHSEQVINLAEDIMLEVRGGRYSAGENARRMLKWSPTFSASWHNVDCLTLPQVLQTFARGVERGTLIDVGLPGGDTAKPVTLQRYAQMDTVVYIELFIRSIDDIRRHLPAALGLGQLPLSAAAREAITITASTAAIHACAVHICTACKGFMHWSRSRPSEAEFEELAFAWRALRVDDRRRAEMQSCWQRASRLAHPVHQQLARLDAELLQLLDAHDSDSNESFKDIVDMVKRVIHTYEKQRGILAAADMHILYTILTPFEFGVLSAIQLPRTSVQHVMDKKIYPYPQPGRLVDMMLCAPGVPS